MKLIRFVYISMVLILVILGIKSDADVFSRFRAALALCVMIELACQAFRALVGGGLGSVRQVVMCLFAIVMIGAWGAWIGIGYWAMEETAHQLGLPFEGTFIWWRSRYDWWLIGAVLFGLIYGMARLGRKLGHRTLAIR
jgi:hypothetical protein